MIAALRPLRTAALGLTVLVAVSAAPPAAAATVADPLDVLDDVREAIVALQAEAMLLVELDAFDPVPPALAQVRDEYASYTEGLDTDGLLDWLDDADQDGAQTLDWLRADGVTLDARTVAALSLLPLPTFEALEDGVPVDLDGEDWAGALDDLAALADDLAAADAGAADPAPVEESAAPGSTGQDGSAPSADPATPEVEPGATGPTAPPATATSAGPTTAALLGGAAAIVLAAAGVATVLLRRRRTGPGDADDTLDAGRRLAGVTDREEFGTAVLAEVRSLAGATEAAWLRDVADDTPADTAPSGAPLSDQARAVLAHVTDTARTRSVTAPWRDGEPTAALLAVAVTGHGRVSGVLVARRDADRPFDAAARGRLERLAPMVATTRASVEHQHELAELSLTDGLTALANRRRLDRDVAAVGSGGVPATVGFVMVDVDHFKTYNDTHGHVAGDALLRRLAELLTASVRHGDVVYRYGGEEFAVLLPGADLPQAREVAERIRADVAANDFPGGAEQPGGRVTVSVGVAVGPSEGVAGLQRRADASLYEAKRGGRNRVVAADDRDAAPAAP